MIKLSLLLLLALTISGASADYAEEAELEQARQATAAFGKALKSELMSAMKSGGPIAAIEVCNTRAPAIARTVSLEQDVRISRVSLKNRNPENFPSGWQSQVLEMFESRKQAGEQPASLTWHEAVPVDSGHEFRFMKAIPTGALCLQCHGVAIDPAVAEKLDALYPEDKATGFRQGDLRGAFVVTKSLP
jgi:hypothetical protein